MSPSPRRPRLPRELFETRSHAWHSLGLGDELAPRFSKRQFGGLLLALLVIVGTLFVYGHRHQIAPGYGQWIRVGTVAILIIVGSAAVHWLVRGLSPRLYRRLDPATAGTTGFVVRLLAMTAVVVLALRIAGVNAGTLAVGGAFTAVLLGLAAQQALGGIFAGIVLQSTRPFRVGERVRLVGGALAGSIEGTVTSLGLFYTTLSQGADRLMVPNNVLLSLVVVPLREPAGDRGAPAAGDHRPHPLQAERLAGGTRRRRRRLPGQRDAVAARRRIAAGRRGSRRAAPLRTLDGRKPPPLKRAPLTELR